MAYLIVAVGSALGGMARYGLGLAAARWWGGDFPWGTVLVNVLGSFVIGLAGAATAPGEAGGQAAAKLLRLLIMVGLCGGFTTFSSFSLQTLMLARQNQALAAAANVAVSVLCCLIATAFGLALGGPLGAALGRAFGAPGRTGF